MAILASWSVPSLWPILAWLGWIIAVIQFMWRIIDWRVNKHKVSSLNAVLTEMQALRSMCIEAINTGEVVRTDPQRQFVRQIGWALVGIEGHIRAALGERVAGPSQAPQD